MKVLFGLVRPRSALFWPRFDLTSPRPSRPLVSPSHSCPPSQRSSSQPHTSPFFSPCSLISLTVFFLCLSRFFSSLSLSHSPFALSFSFLSSLLNLFYHLSSTPFFFFLTLSFLFSFSSLPLLLRALPIPLFFSLPPPSSNNIFSSLPPLYKPCSLHPSSPSPFPLPFPFPSPSV